MQDIPGRRGGRPYANHSGPRRFEGSRVGSGSVPTGSEDGFFNQTSTPLTETNV
jgi:hypothetical protein